MARKFLHLLMNFPNNILSSARKARASLVDLAESLQPDADNSESLSERSGYWRTYGGFGALIRSPWIWLSFVTTIILYPSWSSIAWAPPTFNIIPSLLGFTIGGMTVIFMFPNTTLFRHLAAGGEDSFYMDIASKFVHFILVQIVAIVTGMLFLAYNNIVLGFFAQFTLVYALSVGAATAFSLFGIAQICNKYAEIDDRVTQEAEDGAKPYPNRNLGAPSANSKGDA